MDTLNLISLTELCKEMSLAVIVMLVCHATESLSMSMVTLDG